jgi:broad specificity polyphosphatase/5'/3'-nucleotidase SurE
MLNVNLPRNTAAARGYRIANLGLAPDATSKYEIDREADGVRYVTSRWAPPDGDEAGTDVEAIAEGWIPITPLTLDQTAYGALAGLIPIDLEIPQPPAE